MSLELINTLGTLTTVVIVAAAAIAALIQLRHLRAGNQINAMISIGNQVDQIQDANTLVRQKLDSALEDPAYRVTSSRVTGACRCRLSQESIASSMLQHFLLATPMTSWAFSSKTISSIAISFLIDMLFLSRPGGMR